MTISAVVLFDREKSLRLD